MSKGVFMASWIFILLLTGTGTFPAETPRAHPTPASVSAPATPGSASQRPEAGKQLIEFTPQRVAGLLSILLLSVETIGALLGVCLLFFIPIQIYGMKREIRELREVITSTRSKIYQSLPLILEATQERRLRRVLDDDIFKAKSSPREEMPQ